MRGGDANRWLFGEQLREKEKQLKVFKKQKRKPIELLDIWYL
ncbi:1898_t:CDS:2 [Dentiscutata heterogama]|uniref:1898_t:CDS:1 n=1 Tax=Dentiscutata heterogama TaxID=1316150 RepID=A0ACA9K8R3_9GLOM|nr:1898_t:CDS:2 [Dentiscutata heterogama]